MSQEMIDRLRAAYETFSRGEAANDLLAHDFRLHQASSVVDTAGAFEGPDAIRDVVGELEESFENLSFEAEKLIEAQSGQIVVVVHVQGRGRGSGMEIDNRIAHVWTFRDDKAIRNVAYEEPADALKAVGMEE